jgi:sugar/nucleoside kinase (ribokinase family)
MRKLFEVYEMDDSPLPGHMSSRLQLILNAEVDGYDAVVVTDFGHGLIERPTAKALSNASFLAVNTQSNTANLGYNRITKYSKANYVCIDEPEARLATCDRFSPVSDVLHRLAYPKGIVTRGKHGCVTWDGDTTHSLPALAKCVTDTVGAGDAFFAITAPLVRAGGPMHHIGFIGNVVGAIKVGIVGNRAAVDKAALIKSITGLLK